MLFFRKIFISAMKFRYRTLVMFTLLFVVFNAWFMSVIEPETFENTFHAMWWLLTTMTTVGYGDVSPTSEFGRIWAMLVIYTVGIGLFGMIIGQIVESVSHYKRMKEEGKLNYRGENHYVVIGWTAKSKSTIRELFAGDNLSEVVLIDELEKTPLEHERFTYVNGSPTDFETLRKARIEKSRAVLLFAPDGVTNSDLADGKTLLVASTIESYDDETENNIYTIAEILNEKHVGNFKHVKIDEFILSQESVSNLMAKSAQTKGSSHLFTQLLSHQDGENGSDLWEVTTNPAWKTYGDAYEDLKSKGAQLIADRKDLNIIRKLNEPIPTDAVLFVICDKKTFQSI
ncbi:MULTISPECIES: TrkA family potassium uptake protein [unclassified Bacillus (in: firmicutes)]|uniref:potassium channel family protein n=1 Tax=unclassified Bacillus (in: firmicutes) TaxID=185979 RepID=UPI0008E4A20A|nr:MULTISPECIES: ion channel [unclassified Bacillus (in: firmicutes)]SFA72872.1 voltage-gated potassium channel [Bacillus sp. UNCCL13]SFQ62972.1 voltage-gated potassium channel [Bacillus sp. cl95]